MTVVLKQEAVERLGGACECCGVKGPLSILQFHHRNPKTKIGNWNWMSRTTEEVRNAELDKCSLLCANCHQAYHHRHVEYDEWKRGELEEEQKVEKSVEKIKEAVTTEEVSEQLSQKSKDLFDELFGDKS